MAEVGDGSGDDTAEVHAFAPGRVNVIGDHTDYTGGLALPVALELGVTVRGRIGGDRIRLRTDLSATRGGTARPLDTSVAPSADEVLPSWGALPTAVVRAVGVGIDAHLASTVPIGAGLSSSAAVAVALAVAAGAPTASMATARLARDAEASATGVPCGLLDQAASLFGAPGRAVVFDAGERTATTVPWPEAIALAVVDSGTRHRLAESAYGDRVAECRAAEAAIGPLRHATVDDVRALADPVLRRRARHVVTENARVRDVVHALGSADADAAATVVGRALRDSHRSLREDYESSHPTVDDLVAELVGLPGVLGARITGGGWGGSVVVVLESSAWPERLDALGAIRVTPSGGARVERRLLAG